MKLVWKLLFAVTLVQATMVLAQSVDAALPTDTQAFDLFATLWQFLVTKNYAAAVGPVLTLFVWALKKYDKPVFTALRLPAAGTAIDAFLDKPFVSFLLPTVASALGAFVTALATHHSFMDAIGAVWAASSTAIATYVGIKKAGEQVAAGDAAAVAVATKAEAVDALKQAAANEAKKDGAP